MLRGYDIFKMVTAINEVVTAINECSESNEMNNLYKELKVVTASRSCTGPYDELRNLHNVPVKFLKGVT